MIKTLVLWSLLLPLLVVSQHGLTVSVEGVPNSQGYISVGVYNSHDGFLDPNKAYVGTFVNAVQGVTQVHFDNLPNGTYAVAAFYDENGNKKLDTNFLGIPKEEVAFSNAKMKTFGPPSYEECSFNLTAEMVVTIRP
ncbi:MAG: DUF2141 domain-containing protein [Flavobacteriaceae bacterium]